MANQMLARLLGLSLGKLIGEKIIDITELKAIYPYFKNAIEHVLEKPEFFTDYNNPYKDSIRNFKEQAEELSRFYKNTLEKKNA